jgi:hypothetical protein
MWWVLPTSSKNKRAYLCRQTGTSPFWAKRGIPSADERGASSIARERFPKNLGNIYWASESILKMREYLH